MLAFIILWAISPAHAAEEINPSPAPAVAADTAKTPSLDINTVTNERLKKAITAAQSSGKIDMSAATGFLGIPGAPNVNMVLAFCWAIWVGWIFSSVGAFGGVMASVGHISVFGLGDYAASFGKGMPMNKLVTDSIRVSNQWLVGTSSLISSFKYWTMGRIVLPLGIALGAGSLVGSILTPIITQGKISFRDYVGYFGIFVLGLGCYLLYGTTARARAKKQKANLAAKAFEEATKSHTADGNATRVQIKRVGLSRVEFSFCGVDFSFNPLVPIVAGFIVAAVASFLGVGGGFLLVPVLTGITQLPMYLAAGTSAFAVLVGMVTSITTFMASGTPVYWPLIGIELCGIVVGSWLGPITSRYLPDIWLKRIFIIIAFVVGINYVLRGFFGMRLW
ncbi:MAG: sulfite exporter TauE/SafE family protein [Desulfovibrio sp.]|nr:sulfite exporter TauE/SafE family protein [Desulfovibrio sp.]